MKTKNNKWLEDVNKELDNVLGVTLQNVGGDNPSNTNKGVNK